MPQQTHDWNKTKIDLDDYPWLKDELMVSIASDPEAGRRFVFGKLPIFHMPRFKCGWKKFVVLTPSAADVAPGEKWYIGKSSGHDCEISQIPVVGSVRMLRGGKRVKFFAFTTSQKQIKLLKVGNGEIGKAGNFAKIPLL